jgi:hypothetical protein
MVGHICGVSRAQFCQHEGNQGNQGTPYQTSPSGKTAVLAQVLNNSLYQKDYAIVTRKMSQKLVGNWCIVHKIGLNVKLD